MHFPLFHKKSHEKWGDNGEKCEETISPRRTFEIIMEWQSLADALIISCTHTCHTLGHWNSLSRSSSLANSSSQQEYYYFFCWFLSRLPTTFAPAGGEEGGAGCSPPSNPESLWPLKWPCGRCFLTSANILTYRPGQKRG